MMDQTLPSHQEFHKMCTKLFRNMNATRVVLSIHSNQGLSYGIHFVEQYSCTFCEIVGMKTHPILSYFSPHLIMPFLSCPSYRIVSYRIVSYRILSYLILSYLILSYLILSFLISHYMV